MLVENIRNVTITLQNGKQIIVPGKDTVVRKVNTVNLNNYEQIRYYEIVGLITTTESKDGEEKVI